MIHSPEWPFVAAAYVLGVLVPVVFAGLSVARARRAKRRLAAVEVAR